MARFEAWPNSDGPGWLLDVQTDLLCDLATRVVVPLIPLAQAPRPAARLNPVLKVEGADHAMVSQFLAAVPVSVLHGEPVSLAGQEQIITNALDLLLTGV
ncbi:CcdB family protein [Szabonella alba]|uniref:Toxin CcdB n=1 Tax=Szabonella alba TaxID=2804194 RepID=A0A8K0VGY6_9RHOB|nr:CcdB family protein [Szabonella alba]MBL4919257.1 CcdB family protein [Szabonella alba]